MLQFIKTLLRGPEGDLCPIVTESSSTRQQRRHHDRKAQSPKLTPQQTNLARAGAPKFKYGEIIVPVPVMWSAEEEYFIGTCAHSKLPAICQKEAQGQGVPRFGRPHANRQRKLMFLGLCDVCGKPLKHSRKISLSARSLRTSDGNESFSQIEPLLHEECAILSLQQCPSLQRQRRAHRLQVKEVIRYRPKILYATATDIERMLPDYFGPRLIGLGAIDLLSWTDVTEEFLVKQAAL